MMLGAGANSVTAIEPSQAFDVLVQNTAQARDRVHCLNVAGEAIPKDDFDLVLSIGVLHHIPDPKPVVKAAYDALRPGGGCWPGFMATRVIGAYKHIWSRSADNAESARRGERDHGLDALPDHPRLCGRHPAPAVSAVVGLFANVYMRFPAAERRLVILDQINPRWAKYYTREEAEALFRDAGFKDIQLASSARIFVDDLRIEMK